MSDGERHDDENPTTSAADDDDEEDYEEPGGKHFLGFMFGNVDDSGDLDADYLDEDAKEHLLALADKLGPSLTDIDLIKSSPAPGDPSEQDYDEKAEDAIDYVDIDEEYDGPEVEATTEEDHLLSKKDYFSSNAPHVSVSTKVSVFDDENYDEDEEPPNDNELPSGNVVQNVFSAEKLDGAHPNGNLVIEEMSCSLSQQDDSMDFDHESFQKETNTEEGQLESKTANSLPVLCIENGSVIMRFSEIFGVQDAVRKPKTDHHKRLVNKELHITNFKDIVEEDEEVFLRSTIQDFSTLKQFKINEDIIESDSDDSISDITLRLKDSCLSEQPMKDGHNDIDIAQQSPVCPDFYPLEHEDWENDIIWCNSPATEIQSCLRSCAISEESGDIQSEDQAKDYDFISGCCDVQCKIHSCPLKTKPFDCAETETPASVNYHSPEDSNPLLRKEASQEKNNLDHIEPNNIHETVKIDTMQHLKNLSLLNKDLLEGSWLDNIIWDSNEDTPKPKLIFDLKDDQMLFEILDENNGDHLRSHARAMVVSRSMKTSTVENFEHNNQTITLSGRFNISNDKFYSNRKLSQQAKSHTKKRASMGIKVVHSAPAHKLQTMKPKLSNKEIAHFHRPKAKWYPHENKIAAKFQGAACSHGPMTTILMTLGGKAVKLMVNAEETPLFVKSKASKKLEFKPSEKIKLFCSGKELQDDISLAMQNVRSNSILHVVRTEIHLWPKAQRLPGENKSRRPPGAFRKKSDLSVKDGHVFLMEYCEERPLLLANAGMGARLCSYYQKTSTSDQAATSLRNNSDGLGTVLAIDPADRSPFLGDVRPGSHQSCLETNMYRAPIFPHKVASTDYLLVRSAKGMLSLRRIDKLYAVGQQEPHMEVFSPGTKNVQNYLLNRILVYVYREFRLREKPDSPRPQIRADELPIQSPLTEAIVRKRLKHCADFRKGPDGHLIWIQRPDFRIPSEEELRKLMTPENVCCYESMQAGQYRLKRLGIVKLTQPVGLASAMNQLPDEAIELAAAAHIERELQITSWNLTSNFVACTNQDRENIERLEITGVGDPSGRGLGFSYVRVTPKAPLANAMLKKKSAAAKGTTVTGTDADLRRLSMDAARELLLKFGVPEDQIDKLTRWHRIAMVRKLSSEQAASGVTIDEIPVSKFARGQRMSFLQLQQQTKEKCQEIWDRQVQSLSAIDGDENGSDTEANSDLDSFAGDLENLLDAEEFDDEDVDNADVRSDKVDGMRGLKMRRCPTQAQINEEIQDDEAEADLVKKLLEETGNDTKSKKQPVELTNYGTSNQGANKMKSGKAGQMSKPFGYVGTLMPKESTLREAKEVENSFAEGGLPSKLKAKLTPDSSDVILLKKKNVPVKEGFKEKRLGGRGENLICGACGKLGHMRTNKHCPKYGEDHDTSEMDASFVRSNPPDAGRHVQITTPNKRLIAKVSSEVPEAEGPECIEKIKPVKFKCGAPEKSLDRNMSLSSSLVSDKRMVEATDPKSTGKVNKIKISNKTRSEDYSPDTPKPSVVIRPPAEAEKVPPLKKIIIKQPKGLLDQQRSIEPRKIRKVVELSSFEKRNGMDDHFFAGEPSEMNSSQGRMWGQQGKRGSKGVMENNESWRAFERQRERQEQRLIDARMYEARKEEELQKAKKKNKKKKKHEFPDDYLLDQRPYKNDRKVPERERAAKRRNPADMTEYAPSAKRRRGGEVELSNLLEKIVDQLRANKTVSYLFLKPVSRKDAPDYLDMIDRPMDLGTIREKVRKMEYKNREEFRHDVAQIALNAHIYNDTRNPGIPPLADQLLEMCDYLLEKSTELLDDAEYAIEDS